MLIVTNGDLELHDIVVHFGNGQRWSPNMRHVFREGSRSRAIDLPGDVRFIRKVDLVYGNLDDGPGRGHGRGPGRGHDRDQARVELWGR